MKMLQNTMKTAFWNLGMPALLFAVFGAFVLAETPSQDAPRSLDGKYTPVTISMGKASPVNVIPVTAQVPQPAPVPVTVQDPGPTDQQVIDAFNPPPRCPSFQGVFTHCAEVDDVYRRAPWHDGESQEQVEKNATAFYIGRYLVARGRVMLAASGVGTSQHLILAADGHDEQRYVPKADELPPLMVRIDVAQNEAMTRKDLDLMPAATGDVVNVSGCVSGVTAHLEDGHVRWIQISIDAVIFQRVALGPENTAKLKAIKRMILQGPKN